MKLRETKWEHPTEPKLAMCCSVRARPLKGLAGRLSRPPWVTRNKQSDCPQNPAHLHKRPFTDQNEKHGLYPYFLRMAEDACWYSRKAATRVVVGMAHAASH